MKPIGAQDHARRLMPQAPCSSAKELRQHQLILLAEYYHDKDPLVPEKGFSGNAHQLPLLQWAPPSLRPAFEALRIRFLADFLRTMATPLGRSTLVSILGIPPSALLVVGRRAELLDLPATDAVAKVPHLRDILLLSRLGIRSCITLARLAESFSDHPILLDLVAEALSILQKHRPKQYLARHHITRHELSAWAISARKRPDGIELPCPAATNTSAVSDRHDELLMHWGMRQSVDPDDRQLLIDVFLHLFVLLRRHGLKLPDRLELVLVGALGNSAAEALVGHLHNIDDTLVQEEAIDREEQRVLQPYRYCLAVDDHLASASLFEDLAPISRPGPAAHDRHPCVWIHPQSGIPFYDGAQVWLRAPLLACIHPNSGAAVAG